MSKLLGIAIVVGSIGIASAAQAGECSSSTPALAARAPAATAQRSAADKPDGRTVTNPRVPPLSTGRRRLAGSATRESGLLQRRCSAITVASRNCARNGVPDLVPARLGLRLSNQPRIPWETIYEPAFDTISCRRFGCCDRRLCPRQSTADAGHVFDNRSALPSLHAHGGVIAQEGQRGPIGQSGLEPLRPLRSSSMRTRSAHKSLLKPSRPLRT